jgi:hypothetical protein
MHRAKTSFSAETFAGAMISVVQYLALLRYMAVLTIKGASHWMSARHTTVALCRQAPHADFLNAFPSLWSGLTHCQLYRIDACTVWEISIGGGVYVPVKPGLHGASWCYTNVSVCAIIRTVALLFVVWPGLYTQTFHCSIQQIKSCLL